MGCIKTIYNKTEVMKVLVLNMDYSPINVTTLQKGFKLVFKGKAEVVSHDEDNPIMTDRKEYRRPSVIRLLKYVYIPFKKVTLSRTNIYRRDDYKCIYCGDNDNLTLDHVVPKCKGGANTWTNLVTCCSDCNIKKGDKDLDVWLKESGLKMRHKPFKPTYLYFVEKIQRVRPDWKIFVGIASDEN
jgi:5-methylcytosine-specific restriction endonuclease McrA